VEVAERKHVKGGRGSDSDGNEQEGLHSARMQWKRIAAESNELDVHLQFAKDADDTICMCIECFDEFSELLFSDCHPDESSEGLEVGEC